MKKIQVSAKNVQKAIEQCLKELNATQDQVDIKIIDEGGLFKKAKVELILEVEEVASEEVEITKEENTEVKETNKQKEKEEDIKEEKTEKQEYNKEERINKVIEIGKEFLQNLTQKMGMEVEISTVSSEIGVNFNVTGEQVSNLIGRRGEALNAIQEILSNVVKNAGIREIKVFFDVENYKNRREMSLINLAERMAKKALKIEKPIKLERMSAYERKIIHTHLQNIEGVTTKSEGEEPHRHLIIIPTKK